MRTQQLKPLALIATVGAIVGVVGLTSRFDLREGSGYMLTGIDGSGSTTADRRRQLSVADELVERVGARATLAFWRYDGRADLLFENHATRPESLWHLQDKDLKPVASDTGSRLDLMLERAASALAARAREHRTEPQVLVIIGDGENTGGSLSPMIARLAANRNLRAVAFIGISSPFRWLRRRDFQPLGSRYIDASWDEASQSIRTMREKMDAPGIP